MKAILEFNLPEEALEHKRALEGSDYHAVLWDFDNELRQIIKHEYQQYTEEQRVGMEKARDILSDICDKYGVKIYE